MSNKGPTIIRSAVLFLILLFPNVYACFMASDLASPLKVLAYLLVVAVGACIPMLFLRQRVYFLVLGALTMWCAPIELASLYLNHNPATTTFVGLIYATNAHEAVGVLGAAWPLVVLWLTVWVFYFILAVRQPNERMMNRRIGLWAAVIGLPVLALAAILFFSVYARRLYHLQRPREVTSLATELVLLKGHKIYPYNIYLNSVRIAKERRERKRMEQALQPFRFGISAPADTEPECYILIIGEAARSTHFGLNGYARNTTPRLMQRTNLVSYPQHNVADQSGTHPLHRTRQARGGSDLRDRQRYERHE